MSPDHARVVIIVGRDRPELYAYFRTAFTGLRDVEVIADRRLPTVHGGGEEPVSLIGRRWQPDIYDELILRGFAIKRLPRADDRVVAAPPPARRRSGSRREPRRPEMLRG